MASDGEAAARPGPKPKRRGPGILMRALYRLPKVVFDLHLEHALFHDRLLLLTHVGRRSHERRTTCLEVVRRVPETGDVYVAAAYGPNAQWLRNIQTEPRVRVRLDGKEYTALAMVTTESWGREELLDYAKKHPGAARWLARFFGYNTRGSVEAFGDLAEVMPIVELVPTPGDDWPV
jgi:deazaflavin-dependent oxidoreductase (nitroreductase family)